MRANVAEMAQGTWCRAASLLVVTVAAAAAAGWAGGKSAQADEPRLPLVFEDNFEAGADAWQPTDPNAWKLVQLDGNQVYSQFQQSKYKPPHRSPLNFSLVRDVLVSDFELNVRVQSTARDYPHRSVVLVFGYQDPAHFYYVHLGQRADDHANQIFIVDDAPRVKISATTTEGTPWDNAWHRVRIRRDIERKSIEIYFDDMQKPVMTATNGRFEWGQVGLGSFDDTGHWDDFELRGVRVVPAAKAE